MLKTKHVFGKHGDVVTEQVARSTPTTEGDARFAGFVFDAYSRMFPDEKRYQAGWVVDSRDYFCKRYNEASAIRSHASYAFYRTHVSGKGEHGLPESLVFPLMPTSKAYEMMQKAVEIVSVKEEKGVFRVAVRVNDSRLYGRFLADWEAAMKPAMAGCSTFACPPGTHRSRKPGSGPHRSRPGR